MAQMQTQGGRIVEIDPILDVDVIGIVLNNGVTIWCETGDYKEYSPVVSGGEKIYFIRPKDSRNVEMIGFARHIIATYCRI